MKRFLTFVLTYTVVLLAAAAVSGLICMATGYVPPPAPVYPHWYGLLREMGTTGGLFAALVSSKILVFPQP